MRSENSRHIFCVVIKKKGIALFVSVLMTMSLSIIAIVAMARLSEATQASGAAIQERRLLLYSQSATNLVMAAVQDAINEELEPKNAYSVPPEGTADAYNFYPADIGVSAKTTRFAYRGRATKFAGEGNTPPGTTEALDASNYCYDIIIDVVEVLEVPSGSSVKANTDAKIQGSTRYYFGHMKTVGVLSCFQKGD